MFLRPLFRITSFTLSRETCGSALMIARLARARRTTVASGFKEICVPLMSPNGIWVESCAEWDFTLGHRRCRRHS
jgi:hypothetical protein